ncbi:MAG: mycofactocin biosynthesis glycosyltransferase MftF [Actinomycetota bacterium]|nr:mycofactocin biosynthesis glycosyltransferase MftF [Actinomycetota bacterium]
MPAGFRIDLDPDAVELELDVWFGGSPSRVMRLTGSGRRALDELRAGPIRSRAAGVLARRLTDAGLAHPRPPVFAAEDLTVVIPVYERADALDGCLAALGPESSVVVVDDASPDGRRIADIAHRHGAKLVRREVNGGPGAARDTGLEYIHGEFVAFLDSDCVPPPRWTERLVGHLADPLVGAVAPRITAVVSRTWAGRYTAAQGSLDLGTRPARVAPGTPVSYVPTAALIVRRAALLELVRNGAVFDPDLRIGEDVDLIWRLHAAGWRVRYDPSVEVRHREPATWPALLSRRFRYGTSAAPLSQRHGAAVAPIVLHPWPALTVAALLAGRTKLAVGAFAASVLAMVRTLRRANVPTRGVQRAMAGAATRTWLGTGRYGIQFAAPLLVAAARGGWGRRAAAASLLLAPPLDAWRGNRKTLDPARFTIGWLADQVCYGAGVWVGCLRQRTTVPLRPLVAHKPLRIESRTSTGE